MGRYKYWAYMVALVKRTNLFFLRTASSNKKCEVSIILSIGLATYFLVIQNSQALDSDPPLKITICVDNIQSENLAATALSHLLPTVKIDPLQLSNCAESNEQDYRGYFEKQGNQVFFLLKNKSNETLFRNIPWLSRTDSALSRLAIYGRLSEFSILLQSLILEHQLANSQKPNIAKTEKIGPTSAIKSSASHTKKSKKSSTVIVRKDLTKAKHTKNYFWENLSFEADLGGRWRSSNIASFEIGGSIYWHNLFFRMGYQPPAQWNFNGRDISLWSFPLSIGWQPTLWKSPTLRVHGKLSVIAEHIALHRNDIDQATGHNFWDIGINWGIKAGLTLPANLQIGLSVDGIWFPNGQTVEIPNGPSKQVNTLGIQTSLFMSWGIQSE